MKPYSSFFTFFLFISLALASFSCNEENDDPGDPEINTDVLLYQKALITSNTTWFGLSDTKLNRSSGSGHTDPLLRVRYNAVAAAMLDAAGRVKADAVFPDESLIVKELYSDANTLAGYAIMYKKAGHKDADANGWVWGYLKANGDVNMTASAKGNGCTSCHGGSGNINYTLMNNAFPALK